ncbi:MAG: DUF488 domain-containing protein [Gemmatimonadales bacterium]
MAIRVVRLGSPRSSGEGLRLGTVRRPPRGVKKLDYARLDYYDLWLPELAPSAAVVTQAMSARTDLSVGGYCEDESHCHRSILRALLADAGADIR